MRSVALVTTTTFVGRVERHSRTFKDIVRWVRSRTTQRQREQYPQDVAKLNLSSDRGRAFEQCVAIVVDAAQRGSAENAAMIGEYLTAIAYAENPEPVVQFSVAEAHMAEERAEGLVEVAETAMAREPSIGLLLAYLEAAAQHMAARKNLNAAVRRELAKLGAGV